jgi:hypothetical protein
VRKGRIACSQNAIATHLNAKVSSAAPISWDESFEGQLGSYQQEVRVLAQNEGKADRAIRVALGLLLLSLTVVGPQSMLGLVGVVPLLTGIVGFCPLYRVLGIKTCATA